MIFVCAVNRGRRQDTVKNFFLFYFSVLYNFKLALLQLQNNIRKKGGKWSQPPNWHEIQKTTEKSGLCLRGSVKARISGLCRAQPSKPRFPGFDGIRALTVTHASSSETCTMWAGLCFLRMDLNFPDISCPGNKNYVFQNPPWEKL